MASDKQIAANRLNARKSTGPRTAAGKMKSALNSRKHGFGGNNSSVVRLEDLDEIYHLRQDLLDLYQPINSQELFAIERIANRQMCLIRVERLEAGLFTACLDKALDAQGEPIPMMSPELAGDGDIFVTREQNRNFAFGEGFHRMNQKPHTWTLFLRYQAQAERQYRRAVEEFERLHALRARFEEEAPEPEPVSPNEPISLNESESNQADPASEPQAPHPVGPASWPVEPSEARSATLFPPALVPQPVTPGHATLPEFEPCA
jgi:hypothetical protein